MEFFKKFLPEKGWGEEKYSELITRYIRLKVGLTTEEQEFVDKYEMWKKTRPIYEEDQKKIQEEKKQELELAPSSATEEGQAAPENPQEEQPQSPPGE